MRGPRNSGGGGGGGRGGNSSITALVHYSLTLLPEKPMMGRLSDSRLVASRLAPRVMHLCAAPAYLERYGRPHALSELARHNCLVGSSEQWNFQQDGRELSLRVQMEQADSGYADVLSYRDSALSLALWVIVPMAAAVRLFFTRDAK